MLKSVTLSKSKSSFVPVKLDPKDPKGTPVETYAGDRVELLSTDSALDIIGLIHHPFCLSAPRTTLQTWTTVGKAYTCMPARPELRVILSGLESNAHELDLRNSPVVTQIWFNVMESKFGQMFFHRHASEESATSEQELLRGQSAMAEIDVELTHRLYIRISSDGQKETRFLAV